MAIVRLGATLGIDNTEPEAIARAYVEAGYSAGICPPVSLEQSERIKGIREAFARHDVMLAEIGVWNNMLHPDRAAESGIINPHSVNHLDLFASALPQ
jgi:sugar phosphate isomerase/epimerase